jgi:hypothetical protein
MSASPSLQQRAHPLSAPTPSAVPEVETLPLRYRPPEIDVDPSKPFEKDKLGRQPFVVATVGLIKAIREPFVIALNAPWGNGKTTTLRLLEPALTQEGVTSLTFNAWELDDTADPLVPLVATLHDRLLALKGYGRVDGDKVARWKKAGSAIAKRGVIAAVKVATAGVLDLGAAAEGMAKVASDAVAKAGEDLAEDLVDAFKRQREAAESFRRLLNELIAYLRATAEDGADPPPLVLIIDELDRCRPTFAVAMLERIKHFFSVPGLVFILAVDLKQLNASTRKVYGHTLDATEYLRRFVDLELALPPAPVGPMVDAMLSACGADGFFAGRSKDRRWVVEVMSVLSRHFELSLRVVERMVTRVMLVVRQTPTNHYMDPILTVFMIFLRLRDPALLRELVAVRVEASALMEAVSKMGASGKSFYESHAAKVIEAHVLYAHNSREYVGAYLQGVSKLQGQASDPVSLRMREIGSIYENVRHENFRRGSISLARIAERIDLVSMDLKDEA